MGFPCSRSRTGRLWPQVDRADVDQLLEGRPGGALVALVQEEFRRLAAGLRLDVDDAGQRPLDRAAVLEGDRVAVLARGVAAAGVELLVAGVLLEAPLLLDPLPQHGAVNAADGVQ